MLKIYNIFPYFLVLQVNRNFVFGVRFVRGHHCFAGTSRVQCITKGTPKRDTQGALGCKQQLQPNKYHGNV